MKLRTGEPWISGRDYGHSLHGLTLNILVREIDAALVFQRDVLGVNVIYSDPDIAVCSGYGGEWMLHADHTYEHHPMKTDIHPRGAGVEFRLHGCDPDKAEATARRMGFDVLSATVNKGHGLREVHIRDQDGYTWVPDVQI